MAVIEGSMICHNDRRHYYIVVRVLISRLILFCITRVVVLYFLTRNMLNEPMRNTQKSFKEVYLFPKSSKLPKMRKDCEIYVILKVSLN